MDENDRAKRQQIGDRLIAGAGYEIGAGAFPSRYAGIQRLTFLDKRTKDQLRDLFKAEIAYDVRSVDQAHEPLDFLIAHHVLEHEANPVNTLVEWCGLIRDGGRMFLSVPAEDNACEKDRLPTPFEHILDDYLFGRDADHFDSKQHVPHFINQWAHMDAKSFWYAEGSVEGFVAESLREARRDGHDLHWHTYTLDVLQKIVAAALWFTGHGVEILCTEHYADALYIVAEKRSERGAPPEFLFAERARLIRAIGMLGLP
jgi:SAM-dependent methyltransferase